MDDYKKHAECLAELQEEIIDALKGELAKGIYEVDTEEIGKVADIIKDLSEAKEKCLKAKYYETVIEAMEDNSEKYGYYRPQKRIMYEPYMDEEPYIDEYLKGRPPYMKNQRMGYRPNGSNIGSMSDVRDDPNASSDNRQTQRYGDSYNEYREARRKYTRTNSTEDKRTMDMAGMAHVKDLETTVKDIWDNADKENRKKLKEALSNLIEEMDE